MYCFAPKLLFYVSSGGFPVFLENWGRVRLLPGSSYYSSCILRYVGPGEGRRLEAAALEILFDGCNRDMAMRRTGAKSVSAARLRQCYVMCWHGRDQQGMRTLARHGTQKPGTLGMLGAHAWHSRRMARHIIWHALARQWHATGTAGPILDSKFGTNLGSELGCKNWGQNLDPNAGPQFEPQIGLPIWPPTFEAQILSPNSGPKSGPKFGHQVWTPHVSPAAGTQLESPGLVTKLRPQNGVPNLGPRFGCQIWAQTLGPNLDLNFELEF